MAIMKSFVFLGAFKLPHIAGIEMFEVIVQALLFSSSSGFHWPGDHRKLHSPLNGCGRKHFNTVEWINKRVKRKHRKITWEGKMGERGRRERRNRVKIAGS